jgi:outer membrane protein W
MIRYFLGLLLFVFPIAGRSIILEFKGAYFLSTDSAFKNIYGNGGALAGPELTVQLCEENNLCVFASVDYFKKKGHSIGLCNKTTVEMIPVGLGFKYVIPTFDHTDFYVGLGLEAMNLRTTNCSDFVVFNQSQWGFGGIAKVGAYYYLPCNLLLDFFIDYSFVRVGSDNCNCLPGLLPIKANVSGAIFGIGLGYNF